MRLNRTLVAALFLSAVPCIAQDWNAIVADAVEAALSTNHAVSGEELYRSASTLSFATYVAAVVDVGIISPRDLHYCIPQGVVSAQIADVVRKYLVENPARRHLGGAHLVRAALRDAWPCPWIPSPAPTPKPPAPKPTL